MAQEVLGNVLKKGEEMFQTVSGKLLERPAVQKAVEAAMVGKSKVDEGVAVALKKMNVQTRGEFRHLKHKVDALEAQVAELREKVEAMKAAAGLPLKPKGAARKAAKKA
jgi:polyhydroxyalkanoate synthesis regulator phasin